MGKDLRGKELGEGIYQQSNGTYCARFVDRFGRRKSKRSKKLQEVRQWIADSSFTDQHSNTDYPDEMTVDAWYEHWIKVKEKTIRYETVKMYKTRYEKNIKKEIGNKLLKDVRPMHCQQVLLVMADNGYSSSTIRQTKATLVGIFGSAQDNDIIINNPCKRSVKSNIGKEQKEKRVLTIDEQRRFFESIKNGLHENQFRFAAQTGLRTGELVGLKWSDVDFVKKTLSVKRTYTYDYENRMWREGPPKSKAGTRVIPLTDEAIRILKNQKEKNRKIKVPSIKWADQIFLNEKGEPIKNSAYDNVLHKVCEEAEIKYFSMHVLRHTFATRCIEAGMKPKTLQKILGHSSLSITMDLYVHVTEDEKKKEIDLVADALNVI